MKMQINGGRVSSWELFKGAIAVPVGRQRAEVRGQWPDVDMPSLMTMPKPREKSLGWPEAAGRYFIRNSGLL